MNYKDFLLEGNPLGRFKALTDKGYYSVVLSAERGERSKSMNKTATKQLQDIIEDAGYTYHKVKGTYAEEGQAISEESSFQVFASEPGKKAGDRLFREARKWGSRFEQESILEIDDQNVGIGYYLKDTTDNKKGDKIRYGQIHYVKRPYHTGYKPSRKLEHRPGFSADDELENLVLPRRIKHHFEAEKEVLKSIGKSKD